MPVKKYTKIIYTVRGGWKGPSFSQLEYEA